MDYAKIYEALISRARGRDSFGVFEKHHIIPRCLGGSDERSNIVRLTPEEHYLAHQILMRIHPRNEKLALAALMMTTSRQGTSRSANKLYGWVRRKAVEARKGIPRSAAVRQKISEKMSGKNHPNWGKKNSAETKAKRLASMKLRKKITYTKSAEAKKNHSLGAAASYASGRKKSTAGLKYSAETRKRMSENWHASRGIAKRTEHVNA